MNFVDVIIIAVALLWLVRGFVQGFFLTLTSLAGIVAGVMCAIYFSDSLASMMGFIENESIRVFAAYILIFLIVSTGFRIVGLVFRGLIKKLKLGGVDSFLGAALSLVEAAALVIIMLLVVVQSPWEGGKRAVKESVLAPRLLYVSKMMIYNLPPDVQKKVEPYFRQAPSEEPLPPKKEKGTDKRYV